MNIVLHTTREIHHQLKPFTFTRPASHLRCGIFTIAEKWEKMGAQVSDVCEEYLQKRFPLHVEDVNTMVAAHMVPSLDIYHAVASLKIGEALYAENKLMAACISGNPSWDELLSNKDMNRIAYSNGNTVRFIERPWHIFQYNGEAIGHDYKWLTRERKSAALASSNRVRNPENVFAEEGAIIECATINASSGPVYIAKDAEIMEGSMIRGPFALGEGAVVKMGTKIYGPSTIGPYCKVGGEINNSILFSYSNKAHDGFMGNSVIGEWCNLGADTNTSNLKNNYSSVSIHSYGDNTLIDSGTIFCGMMMGDHSKAGINTMFNTGTCVDVCVNVFGADFPPKHIPSFQWGGANGFENYDFDKAMATIREVKQRRQKELSADELQILLDIFNKKV